MCTRDEVFDGGGPSPRERVWCAWKSIPCVLHTLGKLQADAGASGTPDVREVAVPRAYTRDEASDGGGPHPEERV